MVWRSTTTVGVGIAKLPYRDTYVIVVQYQPPGNTNTPEEYRQNVHPVINFGTVEHVNTELALMEKVGNSSRLARSLSDRRKDKVTIGKSVTKEEPLVRSKSLRVTRKPNLLTNGHPGMKTTKVDVHVEDVHTRSTLLNIHDSGTNPLHGPTSNTIEGATDQPDAMNNEGRTAHLGTNFITGRTYKPQFETSSFRNVVNKLDNKTKERREITNKIDSLTKALAKLSHKPYGETKTVCDEMNKLATVTYTDIDKTYVPDRIRNNTAGAQQSKPAFPETANINTGGDDVIETDTPNRVVNKINDVYNGKTDPNANSKFSNITDTNLKSAAVNHVVDNDKGDSSSGNERKTGAAKGNQGIISGKLIMYGWNWKPLGADRSKDGEKVSMNVHKRNDKQSVGDAVETVRQGAKENRILESRKGDVNNKKEQTSISKEPTPESRTIETQTDDTVIYMRQGGMIRRLDQPKERRARSLNSKTPTSKTYEARTLEQLSLDTHHTNQAIIGRLVKYGGNNKGLRKEKDCHATQEANSDISFIDETDNYDSAIESPDVDRNQRYSRKDTVTTTLKPRKNRVLSDDIDEQVMVWKLTGGKENADLNDTKADSGIIETETDNSDSGKADKAEGNYLPMVDSILKKKGSPTELEKPNASGKMENKTKGETKDKPKRKSDHVKVSKTTMNMNTEPYKMPTFADGPDENKKAPTLSKSNSIDSFTSTEIQYVNDNSLDELLDLLGDSFQSQKSNKSVTFCKTVQVAPVYSHTRVMEKLPSENKTE